MFRTILLPVDLNEESSWRKALPAAVYQLGHNGGTLHVLTVLPDFGESIVGAYFPSEFVERSAGAAQSALDDLCSQNLHGDISYVCGVRTGAIYREIMRYADEANCDLIVMASHRPELRDYLLGPNAARVVRHAEQSVLVVRD